MQTPAPPLPLLSAREQASSGISISTACGSKKKQDTKQLELRKVLGTENPADMMTKHLARGPLDKCMGHLNQSHVKGRFKAGLDVQGSKGTVEGKGGTPSGPPAADLDVPAEALSVSNTDHEGAIERRVRFGETNSISVHNWKNENKALRHTPTPSCRVWGGKVAGRPSSVDAQSIRVGSLTPCQRVSEDTYSPCEGRRSRECSVYSRQDRMETGIHLERYRPLMAVRGKVLTCRAGPPPGTPPPPGPPPGALVAVARTERIPFGPDCPGRSSRTSARRGIRVNSSILSGVGSRKDRARRVVVVVGNIPTQEEETSGSNPRAEDAQSSRMVHAALGPRRSVNRTSVRRGEALINSLTLRRLTASGKGSQYRDSTSAVESPTKLKSEPSSIAHSTHGQRDQRVRPLMANPRYSRWGSGTGNTLDYSIVHNLVRALRSAHESLVRCQGAFSACRRTGYNSKLPAYRGRHIAPHDIDHG